MARNARSVGLSLAIIARMRLPHMSAHARSWASRSFADHSPGLGADAIELVPDWH